MPPTDAPDDQRAFFEGLAATLDRFDQKVTADPFFGRLAKARAENELGASNEPSAEEPRADIPSAHVLPVIALLAALGAATAAWVFRAQAWLIIARWTTP